jgi:hypothetical protein
MCMEMADFVKCLGFSFQLLFRIKEEFKLWIMDDQTVLQLFN